MAIDPNDFVEGIDPSGLSQLGASELLQLIREAKPTASRGGIIYSATTPDVVTTPRFKRYLWFDANFDPPRGKVWSEFDNEWVNQGLVPGSIGSDEIKNNSIGLDKLFNPNDEDKKGWILRVNVTGNGWVLEPLVFPPITIGDIDIEGQDEGDFIRVGSEGELVYIKGIPLSVIGLGTGLPGYVLLRNASNILVNSPYINLNNIPPGNLGQILETVFDASFEELRTVWRDKPPSIDPFNLQFINPLTVFDNSLPGEVSWTQVDITSLLSSWPSMARYAVVRSSGITFSPTGASPGPDRSGRVRVRGNNTFVPLEILKQELTNVNDYGKDIRVESQFNLVPLFQNKFFEYEVRRMVDTGTEGTAFNTNFKLTVFGYIL